jgi:hypothetical protein
VHHQPTLLSKLPTRTAKEVECPCHAETRKMTM